MEVARTRLEGCGPGARGGEHERVSLRTFCIETWGCQMNVLDSQHLAGELRAMGLSAVERMEEADVALLNTCSVRDKAVQKVLTRLGELRRWRRESGRPQVVGLCGCVAEHEGARLLAKDHALSFVLGPARLADVRAAVEAANSGEQAVFTGFASGRQLDFAVVDRRSAHRHLVTAVHGCSQHCTFCVVPYTRGHELSRPLAEIVAEVQHIAQVAPNSEVTLLGQTVNAYRCPDTGADLADLLEALAGIAGVWRVQFLTSHPKFFTDKLIRTLARLPNRGRYLHLPVQSGSSAVLRRMRRGYTREEYLETIHRIRGTLGDVNLSTDIIVAFPGEGDEDFAATLSLVEEVRFGQLYGFVFSPRPRTPAARYPERVPRTVARQRIEQLFAVQGEIQLALNQSRIGTTVEVLVDGPARRGTGLWQGRGDDNRVVNFPAWEGIHPGELAPITIGGATAHALIGRRAETGGVRPSSDT